MCRTAVLRDKLRVLCFPRSTRCWTPVQCLAAGLLIFALLVRTYRLRANSSGDRAWFAGVHARFVRWNNDKSEIYLDGAYPSLMHVRCWRTQGKPFRECFDLSLLQFGSFFVSVGRVSLCCHFCCLATLWAEGESNTIWLGHEKTCRASKLERVCT